MRTMFAAEALLVGGLACSGSALAQQISTTGTYLDLENVSVNDVFGTTQQAGGVFINGGFVTATGSSGTYTSLINANSYAQWSDGSGNTLSKSFVWQGSGNQIGFSTPVSQTVNGVPESLLGGTFTYNLYDAGYSAPANSATYTTYSSTGLTLSLPSTLTAAPFVQNVSYNVVLGTNNQALPEFSWSQPSGYTPDSQRVEIWKINPGGQSTDVANYVLSGSTTSFTVPSGLSLTTGGRYAVDIEDLSLLNPGTPGDLTNANILTRSRSLFDFSPTSGVTSPSGVALPMVQVQADGSSVYEFNDAITAGSALTIDPTIATGYLYQKGANDPNFTSVTLPSVGTGVFQLYLKSGGQYVDVGTILAGQTYTFAPGGVSSFEVEGINPGVDASNAGAFATTLTFASSGQFTGTMTPLSPVPLPAAAWLLMSGLVGLGAMKRRARAA